MTDYRLLDLGSASTLTAVLNQAERVGLDTEFMREKTFFPQLCLVQLSTSTGIWCADPLDEGDHAPFWQAVMGRQWVVHSARQDIEVIYQATGIMPASLFDTQVAAGLLGYPAQMGYANLVSELFDRDLAKSHTRADWSRRPLSEAVLQYAAEDVEYLLPAYEELSARLQAEGRLEWAIEDSAEMLHAALYDNDPLLAVNRVKGARNLRGGTRLAATALAAWREREAVQKDRPRQWILKDSQLLEIATRLPRSEDELVAIPGMPERTARRAARELLPLLADASRGESSYVPPQRPDEAQKALLKTLQSMIAERAESLGITAEIIAARKDLSAAISGDKSSRLFRGWRDEVIGQEIAAKLAAN